MSERFETCTLDVGEDIVRLSNGIVAIWFNTLVGTFDFSSADLTTTYFSRGFAQVHTSEGVYDSRKMTYREVTSLDFNDERGKGKAVVIRLQDPEKRVEMYVRLSLVLGDRGYNCIVQVRNRGEDLTVSALEPLVIEVENNDRVQTGWNGNVLRFFKNGFSSWDLSQALPLESGENVSHTYSVLSNIKSNIGLILGFVTLANHFTTISFLGREEEEKRLAQIVASSQADNIPLKEKGAVASEELYILVDCDPREGLAQYVRFVSQKMKARVVVPPVGWCSWYYYFNRPNEGEIIENARFLEERFLDDIRWIQLDDGYQKSVGDWEENSRFQGGLQSLVKSIKSFGFRAGIWTAPFIASQHSELFKDKPDWFVKDDDNQAIIAGENPLWLGKFYALDLTHPQVINYIRDLFTRLYSMGFEYFKIDFLHHATCPGKRQNQAIPRCAAFRRGMTTIREAVGDSYILGCGAPLAPSVGIVDGMRIGTDIGTVWKYEWGGGVYECAINTLSRAVLHNQWWLNDPDCVLVRQDDSELSQDEVTLWATMVALNGGALMLSDNMREVSEERLNILDKIMPLFEKGAKVQDYLVESEPRVFALPIETPMGRWVVVAAINLGEQPIDVSIPFCDLDLQEETPHHVFNFWSEQYEGLYERTFDIKGLKPHTSRLFCISPESPLPVVISTSMHYTQGGIELADYVWDETSNELSVTVKRSMKKPEAVFFALSGNWTPVTAHIDEEQVELDVIAPEVVAIRHQYVRGQMIRVRFARLV